MQGKYALPHSRGKRGVTVLLTVLAVLLAAGCAVSFLLFSDPNADRFGGVKPDGTVARKVLAASLTGGESSFSPEEVNGFLAGALQDYNAGKPAEKQLRALAVADASGNSADLYLRVPFRGKLFGVLLHGTPGFDDAGGRLRFRVDSARVGRLPVPVGPLLAQARGHLPNGFSAEGDTVCCSAPGAAASYGGISGSVRVTGLQIRDGRFVIGSAAGLKIAS